MNQNNRMQVRCPFLQKKCRKPSRGAAACCELLRSRRKYDSASGCWLECLYGEVCLGCGLLLRGKKQATAGTEDEAIVMRFTRTAVFGNVGTKVFVFAHTVFQAVEPDAHVQNSQGDFVTEKFNNIFHNLIGFKKLIICF